MIYLILHNIRSAYNVGAIFRSADAAGVECVFLTGYTPKPIDRFGRPQKQIAKTALGAEGMVPWIYRSQLNSVMNKLRKDNIPVIALEQSSGAVSYKAVRPPKQFALLVGNEVRGISPRVLKHCDQVIEIPMHGEKESLNVSVAAGIALFELARN